MKAVVIAPKNKTELKFVNDLLQKLGIASSEMSEEEMEDIGLVRLMKNADRSKKVSRTSIMKKLK
jgi:hypothetical protein